MPKQVLPFYLLHPYLPLYKHIAIAAHQLVGVLMETQKIITQFLDSIIFNKWKDSGENKTIRWNKQQVSTGFLCENCFRTKQIYSLSTFKIKNFESGHQRASIIIAQSSQGLEKTDNKHNALGAGYGHSADFKEQNRPQGC